MRMLTAIAFCALALAACGRPASQKNVTVVLPGSNGTSVVIGDQAPPNLPDFVKIYPGAKVTASTSSAKGGVLAMETSDAPDAVVNFYKQGAAAAGMTVQMDSSSMGGSTQSRVVVFGPPTTAGAPNPNGKSLTATVSVENGVTKVGLLYGES